MAFNLFGKKKQTSSDVVGKVRRAQLVTTFGNGAIVDMPSCSVVIAAPDYWSDYSPVLHEPNLERLLRVRYFKQPYASDTTDFNNSPDIPAFRFPVMHFCPECGRLMPYWSFGDKEGKICEKCKKQLVPSRFIAACINGHLEDFPYNWWVHKGDFTQCPDHGKNDNLRISFSEQSGGLDSITIECTSCGKTRTMAGSMGKDALHGYHCRGKRPWIGKEQDCNDPITCEATMRGLQRGASNVYFPVTASALTIPPWSSKLQQELDKYWAQVESALETNPSDAILKEYILPSIFGKLIKTGKYSIEDIFKAIQAKREKTSVDYTSQNLMEDEYKVFCKRDYENPDDVQFRIESTKVSSFLQEDIDDVILVKRLREVLALRGFRRITPEKLATNNEKYKGYHMTDDCIPLGKTQMEWFPAIEMLGEGLFVRVNEEKLRSWEEKNRNYYDPMFQRLERSNIGCENFSPRYVLLHTLSHLLIRQLSLECGYSGAAVKERIYSTYPNSDIDMAGILLYTSTSDSDGSLGGLVRQGLPDSFEKMFRNMLQEASWCSSDPVCIESKAQGYDSLNYAACHACTLLPETSCIMRNCLLDRGAIVGPLLERERGFFGDLLNGKE